MNSIILSKIFVDFFWEFKFLNVLFTSACVLLFVFMFVRRKRSFKIIKADIFIFIFLLISFYSILISTNFERGILDFLKIVPLFFMYGLGRLWGKEKNAEIDKIAYVGVGLFFIWVVFSQIGIGYLNWGVVKTFVGGYYFKTDFAISVLIFLIFICFSNIKNQIKYICLFLSVFLVFLANSRISIPLVFLIYILSVIDINKFYLNIGRSFTYLVFFGISLIFLLSLIDFTKFGMIGFDLKDPFSESSTQGRSQIWAAVIEFYNNSSLGSKIFGSGMAADLMASAKYAELDRFEGSRAHNSYLWLIVCMGWAGLISLLLFFWFVIVEISWKIKQGYFFNKRFTIFAAFLMVFFIMSISVEVIIRTQFTYFLFLYAGLCCNRQNLVRLSK